MFDEERMENNILRLITPFGDEMRRREQAIQE